MDPGTIVFGASRLAMNTHSMIMPCAGLFHQMRASVSRRLDDKNPAAMSSAIPPRTYDQTPLQRMAITPIATRRTIHAQRYRVARAAGLMSYVRPKYPLHFANGHAEGEGEERAICSFFVY